MNESNITQFEIHADVAHINSSTLNGLDIFSEGNTHYTSKLTCLYALLNHCRTAQGQKLLNAWIRYPLLDVSSIESRLVVVKAFVGNHSLRKFFSDDFLKRFPDCAKLSRKFTQATAGLEDCYRLYCCLERFPEAINRLLEADSEALSPILGSLQQLLADFDGFIKMVGEVLDFEAVETKNEFLVREDYDPSLPELRGHITALEVEIEREGERVAFKLDMDSKKAVKIEKTPHHGIVFKIPRKDERALRGQSDITVIDTTKAGIRFDNCHLRELDNLLTDATAAYKARQIGIVSQITAVAAEYCQSMIQLGSFVSSLDVLVSFSVASTAFSYVCPTIYPRGYGVVELEELRHPLVEARGGGLNYITNNACLRKDGEHFIVVTGPNMGGKSTYIKSLAIAVLMAQIGCFVPCKSAHVSLCSGIYARVGANDDESLGVSTFMAEMLETAAILKSADSDSLVIIDELGRGTSTVDGLGLAWAISQHIACEIGCFCLFATHFHELARLRNTCGQAVGLLQTAALVEDGNFTLLHQIVPGVSDKSFGVEVAVLTGFPANVVEEARKAVVEMESEGVGIGGGGCGCSVTEKKNAEDAMDEFLMSCYMLSGDSKNRGDAFSSAKRKLLESGNPHIHELLGEYL